MDSYRQLAAVTLTAFLLAANGCGSAGAPGDPSALPQPTGVASAPIQACQEQARAVGDFDGNGNADILMQHQDGRLAAWLMNGKDVSAAAFLPNPGIDWRVAAIADFDADGRSDILLRHDSGEVAVWRMSGLQVVSGTVVTSVAADWTIAAAGDFDADGHADVLLRNADGRITLWRMDGATVLENVFLPTLDAAWVIAAASDFNGDGKADIAFQHQDGARAMWLMNGGLVIEGRTLPAASSKLFIAGAGDFDGDGRSDLLLQPQNPASGVRDSAIWYMNGTTLRNGAPVTLLAQQGAAFVAGVGDFDGSGKDDILLRYETGLSEVALVKTYNAEVITTQSLPNVAPEWYARTCDGPWVCANAALDGDETDVDCGGSLCAPCGSDLACNVDEDCAGDFCASGKCTVKAVSITAGENHTCVLSSKGTVHCWGRGTSGQLGNGSPSSRNIATPVIADGIVQVSAGSDHTCAVDAEGAVSCWGRNLEQQLGKGALGNSFSPTPVLPLGAPASTVGAGVDHTCAALEDGTLRCWGWSTNGTLLTPTAPPDSSNDNAAVEAGAQFACALVTAGASSVRCWGMNFSGELGDGTNFDSSIPRNVSKLDFVTALAVGSSHACAIAGGLTKCWGNNVQGQLGNGSTTNSNVPSIVGAFPNVTSISASANATCVAADGDAYCWGTGAALGGATVDPTLKSGLGGNVVQVGVGASHACALKADGTVRCWGAGSEGQLGNGTNASSTPPVQVRFQ